jgi:hypothetical protein
MTALQAIALEWREVCEKINFLNGIAMTVSPYPSPHHPLIMFFCGIIRHQKADGRSPRPSTVTPTVSPPTGGTAIRDGFWNAALHLQARHFRPRAATSIYSTLTVGAAEPFKPPLPAALTQSCGVCSDKPRFWVTVATRLLPLTR